MKQKKQTAYKCTASYLFQYTILSNKWGAVQAEVIQGIKTYDAEHSMESITQQVEDGAFKGDYEKISVNQILL